MKTLASGTEKTQLVAVELLDQIEGPAASFCLTILALDKPSDQVRKNAIRSLKHRDPRDVIGWLITLIHRPYKYEVRPEGGPGGTDVLMVDGERFDIRRIYRFPGVDIWAYPVQPVVNEIANAIMPTLSPAQSSNGSPPTASLISMAAKNYGLAQQVYASAVMEEVFSRASLVQQTLDNDVRLVRDVNAQIDETNGRVLPLMSELTGQDLSADPQAWRSWWADQLGLVSDDRYSEKPTVTDFVSVPDFSLHHSCFAAGTLVQTITGPKKIESIVVGDRVMSQNTSNGALSFQPVLATHVNGPATTLRITIDGETAVATGIHRFWKAGKGWMMARELNVGDRLRVLGGIVSIQSIEPGATQLVYNLDVASDRNFLVGRAGLLVHDFSFVQPVSEPFDRQTNPVPAAHK
jgi:pretoxin HINT domain-containing protein